MYVLKYMHSEFVGMGIRCPEDGNRGDVQKKRGVLKRGMRQLNEVPVCMYK